MTFLIENLATILISLLLLFIVFCIIKSIRKDKKAGKSTCGGSCGCCPNGSLCHREIVFKKEELK